MTYKEKEEFGKRYAVLQVFAQSIAEKLKKNGRLAIPKEGEKLEIILEIYGENTGNGIKPGISKIETKLHITGHYNKNGYDLRFTTPEDQSIDAPGWIGEIK